MPMLYILTLTAIKFSTYSIKKYIYEFLLKMFFEILFLTVAGLQPTRYTVPCLLAATQSIYCWI
jgi:hypothetical protein